MSRLGFTGGRLDRADPLRHDEPGFAAALADPAARLLILNEYQPVMAEGAWVGPPSRRTPGRRIMSCWASRTACPFRAAGSGTGRGALGRDDRGAPRAGGGRAGDLCGGALGARLARPAALRAAAATAPFRAGWGRRCPACGTEHFRESIRWSS
jgi:NAD+ diphosphatase